MRVRGNQSYPSPSASWASNVKVRSTRIMSSYYFIIMKGRNQELGTGQTQRRELSVPESLRAIDKKYDEILEDFHQRRRETPTRDTEQHPCVNCQQREVSHGRDDVQSHVLKRCRGVSDVMLSFRKTNVLLWTQTAPSTLRRKLKGLTSQTEKEINRIHHQKCSKTSILICSTRRWMSC